MTLFEQFQVSIGTIGWGGLIGLAISLINVLLENRKLLFLKIIIEPALFLGLTKLYFLFLVEIVDGILSLYYPFFLLGGIFIYFRFYYCHIKGVITKLKTRREQRIDIAAKLKRKKTYGKMMSQMQGRTKRWAKKRRKPKID